MIKMAKTIHNWTGFITYIENDQPWTEEFDFQTEINDWDNAYEVATKIADKDYDPDYMDLIVRKAGGVMVVSA